MSKDVIIGKKQDELVHRFLDQCGITGTPSFEVKLLNTIPQRVLNYLGSDENNQKYLYMRKVDILIENDNEYWVIEAKPVLNCEAIGQALLYRKYFSALNAQGKPVNAGIACTQADDVLLKLCEDYNVKVWIIT